MDVLSNSGSRKKTNGCYFFQTSIFCCSIHFQLEETVEMLHHCIASNLKATSLEFVGRSQENLQGSISFWLNIKNFCQVSNTYPLPFFLPFFPFHPWSRVPGHTCKMPSLITFRHTSKTKTGQKMSFPFLVPLPVLFILCHLLLCLPSYPNITLSLTSSRKRIGVS